MVIVEKDFDYCKKLVKEFFYDERINRDWDKFKNFNFLLLDGDEKYGKCVCSIFDSDDTELIRAIYILIWGGYFTEYKLPNLTLDELGKDKNGVRRSYRGDTLNTFNTLFSKKALDDISCIKDEELRSAVKEFRGKFLTIGNFYLLPNNVPVGYTKKSSINCYRGRIWKDLADVFFIELKKCFPSESNKDKDEFLEKLYEANSFYFNEINTIEKFAKINFLEKYFDENWNIVRFYQENLNYLNYKDFALAYIKKSSDIIDCRAEKMVEKLKVLIE